MFYKRAKTHTTTTKGMVSLYELYMAKYAAKRKPNRPGGGWVPNVGVGVYETKFKLGCSCVLCNCTFSINASGIDLSKGPIRISLTTTSVCPPCAIARDVLENKLSCKCSRPLDVNGCLACSYCVRNDPTMLHLFLSEVVFAECKRLGYKSKSLAYTAMLKRAEDYHNSKKAFVEERMKAFHDRQNQQKVQEEIDRKKDAPRLEQERNEQERKETSRVSELPNWVIERVETSIKRPLTEEEKDDITTIYRIFLEFRLYFSPYLVVPMLAPEHEINWQRKLMFNKTRHQLAIANGLTEEQKACLKNAQLYN